MFPHRAVVVWAGWVGFISGRVCYVGSPDYPPRASRECADFAFCLVYFCGCTDSLSWAAFPAPIVL